MLSVFSRMVAPKASSMLALTALKYPTRRTLITTAIRLQPAAAATKAKTAKTTATKKAPAKSTVTKSKAKTATKATNAQKTAKPTKTKKTVAKPTKAAAPKKKKVVAKKPKVVKPPPLTKEDLPPKGAGTPYIYFVKKYIAGVQRPLTMEATREHAKAAGATWMAMTEEEKQPFREEHRVAAEQQKKALAQWKENVDPAIVRRINKHRTKLGKPKVHAVVRRAPTSIWKSLPEAEKQVYVKQAAERKTAMA
ncbi:hypothetical protein OE88DRAFT_1666040 [Heliocybe sulcata]|uniref:HMG box domain-containing protein n=1 Tax=Heliocybe sulcata TaxID=5364 RepID=A0A5C3MPL5_9AGAM|nr:hypothetical protein OE88DRAFT_1666040 [Heliocybe sulcata]